MDKKIDSIINSLKDACLKISDKISNNNPLNMSDIVSTNESNDDVKKLDILSNDLIIESLSKNINVKILASEENTSFIDTSNSDGEFLVTFDPLDGSSNIDSNITVGTIFGIFVEKNIKSVSLGKSIVAAGYCLYGAGTQLVYTKKSNNPIVEFFLMNQSTSKKEFTKISNITIPQKGNMYSINESNKQRWLNNDKYNLLVQSFINNSYTQRWVGSLVADAHRTIIKGGYFSYPADSKNNGKLRLLYEAIPFCFIFEQAGGKAYLNDKLTDWKDTKFPDNVHQKIPLTLTSTYESDLIKSIFN